MCKKKRQRWGERERKKRKKGNTIKPNQVKNILIIFTPKEDINIIIFIKYVILKKNSNVISHNKSTFCFIYNNI